VRKLLTGLLVTGSLLSTSGFAATVSWTDWQSSTANSAAGELLAGGQTVDVEYSGSGNHAFVQTGTGVNYWSGSAYTNGNVDNAPTPAELIALNQGGTVTVTFSETILNPFIAMNSWNGNVVNFSSAIAIDSVGQGYWGTGSASSLTPTGFTGSGEFHGIISLLGAFDSISFTHIGENWHGFTIGAEGLAPPSEVPVPAAVFLFAPALLGFLGLRRKAKLA
jgi:hypothetical protein